MEETQNHEATQKIEIWDNSERAKLVIRVFEVVMGVALVAAISGYFELELLVGIQEGSLIEDNEASANDLRQSVVALIQLASSIISIVVFLNWFRRAYGNLHRLGINHLNYHESMSVWAWFIPFLNLFRPVQIMNEIENETQERIKKYDPSYVIKDNSLLIGAWWALFIISNFLGRYLLKAVFNQDTLNQIIKNAQIALVSDLENIPEALLLIIIVYRISRMEKKLAEVVEKSGGIIVYKK